MASFCLFLASSLAADNTGKIRGKAIERKTKEAITGAIIQLLELSVSTVTDSNGCFGIPNVPPGSYTLMTYLAGYDKITISPLTVSAGLTTTIDLEFFREPEPESFPPSYDSGYIQGQTMADREIFEETATIYTYGSAILIGIDAASGLPFKRILGRPKTPREKGFLSGHNDRIFEYINHYGIPAYSRKKWINELINCREYFVDISKEEHPIELCPGDTCVSSPNGKFSIQLAQPESGVDGKPCINVKTVNEVYHNCDHPDLWRHCIFLLWGPEGSDVVFIKWPKRQGTDGLIHYNPFFGVLDLRTALLLRLDVDQR